MRKRNDQIERTPSNINTRDNDLMALRVAPLQGLSSAENIPPLTPRAKNLLHYTKLLSLSVGVLESRGEEGEGPTQVSGLLVPSFY